MGTIFTNLNSFLKELDDVQKKVVRENNVKVKKLAFQVFREVIKNTPVKKGSLRASWSIAENEVNDHESDYSGGKKGEATREAVNNLSKLDKSGNSLPDKYIVFNNKEYGSYVNDGTSKQAPKKFVEKGIAEAVRKWERDIK